MTDWTEIVRQHGPVVWRTAYRLLNHDADAANCFQRTFVAALELSRREPIVHWPALLRRLATVRALDCLRQRRCESGRQASLPAACADRKAPAPAFGQVVDNIKKARSVTFTLQQKLTPQSPTLEQKWYLQGDAIRLEMPGTQPAFRTDLPVVLVMIADYRQKQALELDFMRKTARKIEKKDVPKEFRDPIEGLRKLTDKDAERVGQEQLNGRKTVIYRLKRIDFLGAKGKVEQGETAKVWVDAASGLPARIVLDTFNADHKGKSLIVFKDFTWNVPLDPALFRMEVPQGFTLNKDEVRRRPGGAGCR
jgi:outer membrane lipoprotein-sorting protein